MFNSIQFFLFPRYCINVHCKHHIPLLKFMQYSDVSPCMALHLVFPKCWKIVSFAIFRIAKNRQQKLCINLASPKYFKKEENLVWNIWASFWKAMSRTHTLESCDQISQKRGGFKAFRAFRRDEDTWNASSRWLQTNWLGFFLLEKSLTGAAEINVPLQSPRYLNYMHTL